MHSARFLTCHRLAMVGLVAIFALASFGDEAVARASGEKAAQKTEKKPKRPIHGPNYRPAYAAIVVDDKSGQMLHEENPDEPRHPASLTKIMTLYLLFEQLEAGKFKLDSRLDVSSRAALQNPTKLGLKANGTITVEDAIKGLVTKSANDAAVVVAEAIGGSEPDFARMMTAKARMLGMTSTTYVNASGLPDLEQITTARDQAILGRVIQHRFPVYYRYFATSSFRYRNIEMRNHNALLGNVKGVDGIKTGYTEKSGYNLVTSVRRDDKHIVAVVIGGKSNAARDTRMRQLIEEHLPQASVQRTAPVVTELGGQEDGKVVPPAPELAASRSVPATKLEAPSSAKPEPQGSREEPSAKAQTEEKSTPPRAQAQARSPTRPLNTSNPTANAKPAQARAATPAYTFFGWMYGPASTPAAPYRAAR